jgi:hypothetical protein
MGSSLPRRPSDFIQEKVLEGTVLISAVSATFSTGICLMDADYKVDKFTVMMPGGFTGDASNYWVLTLQAGATVLATYSTQTAAQGTLTDLVFGTGVNAALPSGLSGDSLKVVMTKNGAAVNIPAGTRLMAHCHLL